MREVAVRWMLVLVMTQLTAVLMWLIAQRTVARRVLPVVAQVRNY